MPRKTLAEAREELISLLRDFDEDSLTDIRGRVLELIPAFHLLQHMGTEALYPGASAISGRDRILAYFKEYPFTVLGTDEIMVISGISEYGRRVRELRVEHGWNIMGGITAKRMSAFGDLDLPVDTLANVATMKKDDYILLSETADRDAAHRWIIANGIRRMKHLSGRDRMLEYLKVNVGRLITGEELDYVAKISDWPRRTRELRTEEGWSVQTKKTGRVDLPVGMYVLETLEQAPAHDRHISDATRVKVLNRDHHACRKCGWTYTMAHPGDPRKLLELHHLDHHATGGTNDEHNLITLCNVDHDELHAKHLDKAQALAWISV